MFFFLLTRRPIGLFLDCPIISKPYFNPPQGQKQRRRNREMASSIAVRSRLVPSLLKLRSRNPRRALFSTEASSSSKVSSSSQQQSIFSDFPPPNHLPPPPPEAAAEALGKERKGLKYLSNGLIWAFTGATAAIGYTSYGMSLSSSTKTTL